MGFGSYDESEQDKRPHGSDIETTAETIEGDHEGEMRTEGNEDTDALLNQLSDIKSNQEDTNEK